MDVRLCGEGPASVGNRLCNQHMQHFSLLLAPLLCTARQPRTSPCMGARMRTVHKVLPSKVLLLLHNLLQLL